MAKVIDNILVRGLSAKLGDGRTIACNKPDFNNGKLSRDQKEHHKRFKEAAAQLAVGTMKNPTTLRLAIGSTRRSKLRNEAQLFACR